MPLIWLLTYPIYSSLDSVWNGAVKYGFSGISALGFIFFIWKRPTFSFACSKFWRNLFTFGLLGVIGAIGAFVFSSDKVDMTPSFITMLGCILMNLAIAVSEEVIFRGLILHSMLQAWREKKNVVARSIIACSIIFGLRHLLNLITMPDTLFLTLAQVVFTFMAGTYLCAVYIRTGNIWVCIVIHFLEDFGTSVWEIFSSNAAVSAASDGTIGVAIGMIALQIPYVIFTVLMLRDKNWR